MVPPEVLAKKREIKEEIRRLRREGGAGGATTGGSR